MGEVGSSMGPMRPRCRLAEMRSGWWWLQDPEQLEAVARALHPRGIREKALHKHLTKHREYLREVCLRAATGTGWLWAAGLGVGLCPHCRPLRVPPDPIFHPRPEAAAVTAASQEALAQWSVMERTYEADLSVLQWVEELEQRVLMADLQIRVGGGPRERGGGGVSALQEGLSPEHLRPVGVDVPQPRLHAR